MRRRPLRRRAVAAWHYGITVTAHNCLRRHDAAWVRLGICTFVHLTRLVPKLLGYRLDGMLVVSRMLLLGIDGASARTVVGRNGNSYFAYRDVRTCWGFRPRRAVGRSRSRAPS